MPERHDPVAAAMRRTLWYVVRRGLRGVWLRGDPPPGPFVWAANHHSWWDPFVAMVLLRRLHRPHCLLMRQDNLDRYAFARRLGVFGTGEHRRGVQLVRDGQVLVIFPEGRLRPAGPPGPLAEGAAWYADRAPAPLVAAATRVLMRGHEAPEAYVWLAGVEPGASVPATTAALTGQLTRQLAGLAGLAAAADPRQPLPGFTRVIAGRPSWEERVDAWRQPWRQPWRD